MRRSLRPGRKGIRLLIRFEGHKKKNLIDKGAETLAQYRRFPIHLAGKKLCDELEYHDDADNERSDVVDDSEDQDKQSP